MLKTVHKVSNILEAIMTALGVILFLVLTTFLISQVFTRYIYKTSVPWMDEVTRFMLIWLTFVGVAVAVKKKANLGVAFFYNMVSVKWQKLLDLIVDAGIGIVCFIMLYHGILLSQMTMTTFSLTLEIPMGWIYIVIPVSGAVSLFFVIEDVISVLIEKTLMQRPDEEEMSNYSPF